MSELKKIQITREMLPGFRRIAKFPKLVLGSFKEQTVWVAHLHDPILLAKIDFEGGRMLLRMDHGFDFNPTSHAHLDITDAMVQFVREEALEGKQVKYIFGQEYTTPPEFLILAHGGWIVEEEDRWLGVIHTCEPQFIAEINGESILPLDPCEDIGPYLQKAKQFFKESPELNDPDWSKLS